MRIFKNLIFMSCIIFTGWYIISSFSIINGKPFPALLSYVLKSSNYTANDQDYTIDCTGTITITLPDATNILSIPGRTYTIKNSGTGTITIACFGAQTIDGIATQTVKKDGSANGLSCLILQSTGTNWIIIGAIPSKP